MAGRLPVKILKWFGVGVLTLIIIAALILTFSKDARQAAEIEALDTMGDLAVQRMKDSGAAEGGVAADFINIPIEARKIGDGVYQATGVANAQLVTTSAGAILFDTGLVTQAPKQMKALRAAVPDLKLSHIILSHSHADHAGGTKVWLKDGVEIVTHDQFAEEQRYLTELQPYFWHRNRTLFPFMPESPPTLGMMAYGGIKSSRTVANGQPYKFSQGGVDFELMALPGAEGADNLVLWLPQKRILLSGDFFGPIYPQFPNIFTMRGEKIRKPIEYIHSLETIIALKPKMIVPSHKQPITDETTIMAGLIKMRDATRFVHDATVKGMNDGKTVERLMTEIQLPPELALSQQHGRVSWAVKSIWEYYATWFHFDNTTELYPVPASDVYADIVDAAGAEALTSKAKDHLAKEQPVHALHLVDIVLGKEGADKGALQVRKDALELLLAQAERGLQNSYEIYWLTYRLRDTEERLAR